MEIETIHEVLTEAGEIALRYFNLSSMEYQHKADKTVVTEADLKIERFIRERLARIAPDYEVIGEEFVTEAETEFAWVVDPIDGTLPFIFKMPNWCISIGLTRNKEPYLGFVYVPINKDFYYTDGNCSYKNGKVIHALNLTEINNETMFAISNFTHKFFKLEFSNYSGAIVSTGSGIYNNMLLASGRLDMTLSVKPNLWDLAAACAIVKNAGCDYYYYDGTEFQLADVWHQRPVKKPMFFAKRDALPLFQDMFVPIFD